MANSVEIYHPEKQHPFCTVHAEFQPNVGDLVNIKGVTYKVMGRSFTVDNAGRPGEGMRCNVIVEADK